VGLLKQVCFSTRTCRGNQTTSAVGGRTDMSFKRADFRVDPARDIRASTLGHFQFAGLMREDLIQVAASVSERVGQRLKRTRLATVLAAMFFEP
jgi:hypothetical protein